MAEIFKEGVKSGMLTTKPLSLRGDPRALQLVKTTILRASPRLSKLIESKQKHFLSTKMTMLVVHAAAKVLPHRKHQVPQAVLLVFHRLEQTHNGLVV